jgi:hypothetical protein
MSMAFSARKSLAVGGKTIAVSITTTADATVVEEKSVAAGFPGELTTRGGNTEGTVTVTDGSAHTLTNGCRVDLYWTGGKRRGATVGTISGDEVPFTGGSGNNLPSQSESITICLCEEMPLALSADLIQALAVGAAENAQVVFCASNEAELLALSVGAGASYDWFDGDGNLNPMAGDTIGKVYMTHDGAAAAVVKVGLVYNNA